MMLHRKRLPIFLLTLALSGTAVMVPSVVHAATFVVINNNAPGVGFNDPTPAAPVGGNTGMTIGAQRLIAFQFAANIWASRLSSNVPVRVGAQFTPLSCTATSAILGSAGPTEVFRDFSGAPVANTWYAKALANALHGSDVDATTNDINANFSSTIGTPGCLENSGWYYGLDGNSPANRIDFVTVLLHELGHGLNFLTFVDLATGAKLSGFNDTYMLNLENHGASPPDYPSMTNAQRVAASISTGNLHWIGPLVRSASGLLSAGTVGDHVRMFAPNPAQGGSSVSHWDTVLTPNQLLEPSYTGPLHNPVLEIPLFQDISWIVSAAGRTAHDFNVDFMSDILWRDNNSGGIAMWLMNGATVASSLGVGDVPTNWTIVGQRDFDRSGKSDILWRENGGGVAMWLMNGATIASSLGVGNVPANWVVAGTGDFNGDGRGDILWRDNTSGGVAMWLMNGATISSSLGVGNVPTNWVVAGVGDFNGDSKSDILWRDNNSGGVAMWLMDGGTVTSSLGVGNVPANWVIVGTGDFNGDGKGDILWRDNNSGGVAMWLMNGATISSSLGVGNVPTNWQIAQTGDYNADGRSDILWRDNNSGGVAMWLMNGATITSSLGVGSVPTNWQIQGLNAD
jgi:hypothetical protein